MTTKIVAVNYSAAMVAAIVADYNSGKDLSDIASTNGKTVASIRAKLSSLGVYKAKASKPEGKKGGLTKASIVQDIAAICMGDKNALESLQSATMGDLKALLSFLVEEMREQEGIDSLLHPIEQSLIVQPVEPDISETHFELPVF